MIIKTETGSKYRIDLDKKTWKQLYSNDSIPRPLPLRTKSGTFDWIGKIEVGTKLIMRCPPITEQATGRLIVTSPIVKISM